MNTAGVPGDPAAIRRLRAAARRYQASRVALDEAIRAAADSGAALREIAEVAGFSHEGIRKILRPHKP